MATRMRLAICTRSDPRGYRRRSEKMSRISDGGENGERTAPTERKRRVMVIAVVLSMISKQRRPEEAKAYNVVNGLVELYGKAID